MKPGAKMLQQAQARIEAFGVDLSNCVVHVLHSDDGLTANITWTRPDGHEICLSAIWWNKETGEILQAGTNYGALTL